MRFATIIVRNVLRRKVRSTLTALGVGLAIAAVVALLAVASGFTQSMLAMYENRGVDMVVVRAGVADRLTSSLSESLAEELAAIPGVKDVSGSLTEIGEFPIRGWKPDSFPFQQLPLASGRRPTASDKDVVLLGLGLAAEHGKDVGDTFEIEGTPFQVIGIYDNRNPLENASAVVLLADLQTLMDRPGQVTEFQIALAATADAEKKSEAAAVRQAIEALRDADGQSLRLAAMPTSEYVSSTAQLKLARAIAWMTSVIAVVIGGVGILNTMVMAVLERTQEIGVLRSLGWRKSRIMRLILGESLLITLVGAAVGTLTAVAATEALTRLALVPGIVHGDFSLGVLATGLAMALGVGLFGGLYPAWRGANLPPTEALRYE